MRLRRGSTCAHSARWLAGAGLARATTTPPATCVALEIFDGWIDVICLLFFIAWVAMISVVYDVWVAIFVAGLCGIGASPIAAAISGRFMYVFSRFTKWAGFRIVQLSIIASGPAGHFNSSISVYPNPPAVTLIEAARVTPNLPLFPEWMPYLINLRHTHMFSAGDSELSLPSSPSGTNFSLLCTIEWFELAHRSDGSFFEVRKNVSDSSLLTGIQCSVSIPTIPSANGGYFNHTRLQVA